MNCELVHTVGALPFDLRQDRCQLVPVPHLPSPKEVRTKRYSMLREEQGERKVFTWKISITLGPLRDDWVMWTFIVVGIQMEGGLDLTPGFATFTR